MSTALPAHGRDGLPLRQPRGVTAPQTDEPRLPPVLLRRDLVAAGWTDAMLRDAVRGGELAKARRGAYVDGPAFLALDDLQRHELAARAVVAQATKPLVVSHCSGLACIGSPAWGLSLDAVHVTTRDGSGGRAEAGVRRHRGAMREGDLSIVDGLAVMHPTRLGLEITTLGDLEVSLVHLNDLLHRGLTTPSSLRERYRGSMERWPSSLTTDLALRLADGRCESVAESRFLHLCWRHRLPAPVPQYEVRDASGRVIAILDFAWPERGVFVEVDGRAKYVQLLRAGETTSDAVLREKQRENLVRRITGWRGVRVSWPDLGRPALVASIVRRELFPSGC